MAREGDHDERHGDHRHDDPRNHTEKPTSVELALLDPQVARDDARGQLIAEEESGIAEDTGVTDRRVGGSAAFTPVRRECDWGWMVLGRRLGLLQRVGSHAGRNHRLNRHGCVNDRSGARLRRRRLGGVARTASHRWRMMKPTLAVCATDGVTQSGQLPSGLDPIASCTAWLPAPTVMPLVSPALGAGPLSVNGAPLWQAGPARACLHCARDSGVASSLSRSPIRHAMLVVFSQT